MTPAPAQPGRPGAAGAAPDPLPVSVVIPTHQRREAVLRAVRSVLAGEALPREVIVVDDGSDDGTAQALEEASVAGGAPLRVLRHARNRGVAAARNTGIAAARCEWIALLDSDDWWLPEHLASLWLHVQASPECRAVQARERWYRGGRRVNPRRHHVPPSGDIFEPSLRLCLVSSSAVLLRRSLLADVGGYDERLPACEDYDLWLRIARTAPIELVPRETIEKEGGRRDQLSNRFWGMDRFRVYALAKLLTGEGESGGGGDALSPSRRAAVCRVAREKLAVLRAGAEKRGKVGAAAAYGRWTQLFDPEGGPGPVGLPGEPDDPILSALLPVETAAPAVRSTS